MDEYRGQKVLVTGGLGFIGSNLAIRLVQCGAAVTIVDSQHPPSGANLFNIEPVRNDLELIIGDCCDAELMRKVVRGKSHIFSLAGQVSHIDSMEDPLGDLHRNTIAPLTVLEACRAVNREARIVYSGTRQVYGRQNVMPLVETLLPKPVDVNGVNKLAGEGYHLVYHQAYGMATTCLRIVNTYGPRQLVRHARQGFTGWFIRLAMDGEEIQIFGDGQQLRGFNFIDDAVEGLLVAGIHPGALGDYFNLGGVKPVTLEAFVQLLVRIAGKGSYRLIPFPADRKAIDVGSVYTSRAKFHAATGWEPRVTLEEGLTRTVAYYKAYKAHYW